MGISISLNVGLSGESSSITATGNIIEPISDHNINAFGIPAKVVQHIIQSNPKKYGISVGPPMIYYKEVVTAVDVIKAEIAGITSKPIIVKSQDFINNSNVEGTFNVSITDSVSNTSSNTWSTGGKLTFTQKISYGLKFGASGETSMSYEQSWGIGGTESKTYTIGSTSGVTVKLQPGQAVIAELSASRGALNAKIFYNAKCTGNILYYSPNPYGMMKAPVEEIMKDANLSNSIKSDENMEVGYYSNSSIEIRKKDNNQLLSVHYV